MVSTKVRPKTSAASSEPNKSDKKENVFHHRLASLTYMQACSILGESGKALLGKGGQNFLVEMDRDVYSCKQILHVQNKIRKKFSKDALKKANSESDFH